MAKKYEGVRERVKGKRYEVYFRLSKGGKKIFRNIEACSIAEAFYKRQEIIAEYRRNLSLPEQDQKRLTADFNELWEKLNQDILSDKVSKTMTGHYRNTFQRMFIDFRNKYYSHIQNLKQISLPFFKEYKAYYVNELNRPTGWRAELRIVRALMRRLYTLGYCSKDLIEKLQEIKKPKANKREFPDIPKSRIEKLLSYIKQNSLHYYYPIYFMYRTGRRRKETSLIKKSDVVLKGFKPIAINIRAETTKTGERAPLNHLDEGLEKIIQGALSNNKTEWLFANRCGRKYNPNKIYEYLKKVSKSVIGIPITPHYFRHRFITECAKANAPIADVKTISGIKDDGVLLQHYSHSTKKGQEQVLKITSL